MPAIRLMIVTDMFMLYVPLKHSLINATKIRVLIIVRFLVSKRSSILFDRNND
jgi:hypothetical protein